MIRTGAVPQSHCVRIAIPGVSYNQSMLPRPLVLIVDAHEQTRDLYGHWFHVLGFEVMSTSRGRFVLPVLRRHPTDLIVLDLSVNEFDGLATIEQLRHDPVAWSIPVIALTRTREADAVSRARRAGAVDTQPKLGDFESLGRTALFLVGAASESSNSTKPPT